MTACNVIIKRHLLSAASGQAYGMQPMGAQPYGMQPMGAQPYGMQPMGAQPQYGTQPVGAQPQYGTQPMGAQPPMYKNANVPPPAYTYSDPAYPSGAAAPPPAASDQNQPSAPPSGFSTGQSSGSAPQGTNMPQ